MADSARRLQILRNQLQLQNPTAGGSASLWQQVPQVTLVLASKDVLIASWCLVLFSFCRVLDVPDISAGSCLLCRRLPMRSLAYLKVRWHCEWLRDQPPSRCHSPTSH